MKSLKLKRSYVPSLPLRSAEAHAALAAARLPGPRSAPASSAAASSASGDFLKAGGSFVTKALLCAVASLSVTARRPLT